MAPALPSIEARGGRVARVVLETSLKPFMRIDDESVRSVWREALRQWYPLLKTADECSVLFWVADGSEILVWKGDLDEPIEWGRYIGFSNGEFQIYHGMDHRSDRAAKPYIADPPVITYRDLARIVAELKRVAAEEFSLHPTAGATFDPGPEFAHSDFKYRDHREIIGGGRHSAIGPSFPMVRAWSTLEADSARYAGYPAGIPAGTSFGEFLGRQSRSFLGAMGFDYLWLSNGFGFSHFAWSYLGVNFPGDRFGSRESYSEMVQTILSYWRDFKRECPDYPIEVRGTNFAMGMDLSSDFTPYEEIYSGGFIRLPPPNSPWGPLNKDFGLEMVGYLSRIARLPADRFMFRYYPNDPWFWQNPWWDHYDREPFDIYCPMSAARIGSGGRVENPAVIQFLTIDTSRGILDERCPLEVIPHVRRAIDDFPDEPGVVTWLYPFSEYHRIMREEPERADEVFFGDWFARAAVNAGFPLNTVMSTDSLDSTMDARPDLLRDTVLFAPTSLPAGSCEESIARFVREGGTLLLYGPLGRAPAALRELVGVELGQGLSGDFDFEAQAFPDRLAEGEPPRTLRHDPVVSGGPLCEVVPRAARGITVLARAKQLAEERVWALERELPDRNGGRVLWIRGGNAFEARRLESSQSRVPRPYGPGFVDPGLYARLVLARAGYSIVQNRRSASTPSTLCFLARRRNGLLFSGYKQDTTVTLSFGFPEGAPLLVGQEAWIEDGLATYTLQRSFHVECRAWLRQRKSGVVSAVEAPPFPAGKERRIEISGLEDARLVFTPPLERVEQLVVERNGERVTGEVTRRGRCFELGAVTGRAALSW